MRIFGILVLAILVCCGSGAAQSNATNPPRSPYDSLTTWRMFHPQRPDLDLFHSDGPQGVYCFTMRTYTMAREGRNSDVTHLVRYTTCPRADWKLQFRNSEAKPETPDN